jgi:microcystin-dependent protein
MTYIGAAKTPLIYSNNVRDDLGPDGATTTFTLSQEVPGGAEDNIAVLRRKWLKDTLITGSALLSINGTSKTLSCSTAAVSALLSHIQPPIPNIWPGDTVTISGAANGANNKTFIVSTVTFDGTTATITFSGPSGDIAAMVTESGGSISIVRNFSGPWEYLNSEQDYTITGSGGNYNKQISFVEVPQVNDVLYVLHKGDATYNFVPSASSVGPDQLSPNLRNFACDRYTGNGATTVYALSQVALTSKALTVTVDNVLKDGDDPSVSYTGGDWTLAGNGMSITFKVAPLNATKIKILHLGFSTVSRRGLFSPGQVDASAALADASVTTIKIADANVTTAKILDSNITTAKIAADNVTGAKILLANNEAIRGTKSAGGSQNLIKIDASNDTIIDCVTGENVFIAYAGTNILRINNSEISPVANNAQQLGYTSTRWSSGWFQGDVNTNGNFVGVGATLSGNIAVSGTVDGVDVSALNTTVSSLGTTVGQNTPPGVGVDFYGAAAPTGWLLCDGSAVSRATYSALFAVISTLYGAGDGSTTFNLPDCRKRFTLGKAASGTGSVLAATGGTIDLQHTTPAHTHTMANHTHTGPSHTHQLVHTHSVPAHSHTMKNHTHTIGSHSHTIPDHYHTISSHTHTVNDHSHDCGNVRAKIGVDLSTGDYLRMTLDGGTIFASDYLMHLSGHPLSGSGGHNTPAATCFGTTGGSTPGTSSNGAGNTSTVVGLPTNPGGSGNTGQPSDNTTDLSSAGTSGAASTDTTSSSGTGATGTPSTNTTDSGGAGVTDTLNPPFIVVTKIIKF